MADRKHITELALDFCSDGILIVHPKDVSRMEQQSAAVLELANECHIYVIATRPRVSYVPGSVRVGDGKTSGRFKYSRNGAIKETEFWLKGEAIADKIEISEYPHHTLSLVRNDKIIASIPAHLGSLICDHIDDSSLRDLRVVYVGMSYADGDRSAKDRLLSHSTLQQVLADLNGDSPDCEALIVMAQYDSPQTLISFDGRDKSLKVEDDRNLMGDLLRQQDDITEDLQIKLIEAGLIRYFQPSYNEKYKNRFPLPTQQILKEVYEIDFGALVVELNTENVKCRLFSDSREPGYHHLGSFDLHDPAVRRSLFNVMNVTKGSDADDLAGPVY